MSWYPLAKRPHTRRIIPAVGVLFFYSMLLLKSLALTGRPELQELAASSD